MKQSRTNLKSKKIGGIFFKSEGPESLRTWYAEHLGLEIDAYGGAVFQWNQRVLQKKWLYGLVTFSEKHKIF